MVVVETADDASNLTPWVHRTKGVTAMRLEELCVLELRYTSDFHYVTPYEGESGKGWGLGEGTATGDRLSGTVQWSNHPNGPRRLANCLATTRQKRRWFWSMTRTRLFSLRERDVDC